jgi:hypothetical protein
VTAIATGTANGVCGDRVGSGPAVATVAENQSTVTAVTTSAAIDPGATISATAEPASGPTVAAVIAIAAATENATLSTVACRIAGARLRGPAKAMSKEETSVGMFCRALSEEEPEERIEAVPYCCRGRFGCRYRCDFILGRRVGTSHSCSRLHRT